ncbi:MAG: outer membrane lipoprotein carrier protein LolA [Deltaproteobacteria bacterium]|nr:outer membrane lipoprotein carrier protein LolA [Deltaproteobacteria bacterium]
MKHTLFSVLLLLVVLTTPNPAWCQDPLAVQIESRYTALQSWSADFTQTTFVEMLEDQIVKQGKIIVARPNKIRIEYTSSPYKIYASNGDKLWIYKHNDPTAWQFNNPQKVISEEALSFLSGLKNMSEIFEIETTLDEPEGYLKIKNRGLKKIHLIPKKTDAVLKITLGVDAKNTLIKEAVLFNTSGNVTHYSFEGIVFNKNTSDDLFVLPKEPKRKIIKK